MKKTIILFAAVVLGFSASAQVKVHFGVKAGMNASELHGDAVEDAKTQIGFHAGALAHIHGNSNWAFQPEVMYSLEGAKYEVGAEKGNLNLSYINVPLLAQYMFDNGFRIEAGPQIGFLMSAKAKADNASVDVKDGYKSTAISLPVGIGYLTHSGLGFDARYNFGLTDINENGSSVKGNTFQFGIFWQFSDPKINK